MTTEHSTPDSPRERDDKAAKLTEERDDEATKLKEERIEKAEQLAKELRNFRFEVRVYAVIMGIFLLGEVLSQTP